MKKVLQCLLAVAAFALCASAFAQLPTPASPYCGTNSSYQTACYKSHAEAEDFIRADPDGTHPTRKNLMHDSSTLDQGSTLPYENYAVLPVAGAEGAPMYSAGDNNGASTAYVQVACEITGTTGLMQGYGPVSNCSNQPSLCTYGYYCNTQGAVLQAISQGVKKGTCAPGSAWEGVAAPASPTGSSGGPPDAKPQYPPNTGTLHYNLYQGGWVAGFFDFQYQYGETCSQTGGGRLREYKVTAVTCPTGYSFGPGDPPNLSQACRSNEWGYIRSYYAPTDGGPCPDSTCGRYGDPILPSTGATLQTPAGWNAESMLGINLTYNSFTTDTTTGIFGGGWNSLLQYHYAGLDAAWRNYSIVDEEGNVEVWYTPTGNTPLRPLGEGGKVLWSSVANGCEYSIHEANRIVFVSCQGRYYGKLLRVEYPDAPQKNLTFNWSTADGTGALGQATYVNRIESVVRADGRRLDLHYGRINQSGDCSTSAFPFACQALRLLAISDSDGNLTSFSYNAEGRLELINYPDGNRERFEYGNAADVCPPEFPGACDGTANARMIRGLLTGTYIETAQAGGGYDSVRRGTYQYDNRGRAIRTSLPGDALRTDVSYAANGVPTVTRWVDATHFSKRQIAPNQVSMFQKPGVVTDTDSTGAAARSMRTEYDAGGYISKTVDFKGVETQWTNNTLGFPTQRIEAANDASGAKRTTQWDWDTNVARVLEERVLDSAGLLVAKTKKTYNARGQLSAICRIDPSNATAMAYVCGSAANAPAGVRQSRMSYCESADVIAGTCPILGLLVSTDGPRTDASDVTSLSYYAADAVGCAPALPCDYHKGDLRRVTNALGQFTEIARYDGAGRVLSASDANGVVTDLEYDARGRLRFIKRRGAVAGSEADDAVTEYEYDAIGSVTKVTQVSQPANIVLTLGYDAAGRLEKIQDSTGGEQIFTLDHAGNRRTETTSDASGVKRTFSRVFDDLNQLRTLLDANNAATQQTYDLNGNQDLATDALNRVSDSDVDALNRVLKVVANTGGTTAERATTQFQYDARDNLTRVTDPKGLYTDYVFNGLGDLTQLKSPDSGTSTMAYNAAGLPTSSTDARSIVTTVGYDAAGRLTSRTVQTSAQNVFFDYDAPQADCIAGETFGIGRLSRIRDESGSTRYCYDRFGNVVRKVQTVTGGSTLTVGSTYDAAGHLKAMTYPSGAIVSYTLDENGRPKEVAVIPVSNGTQATIASNVTYLPFGPVKSITLGNGGRVQTRSYDQNYGIDAISDNAASNPFSEDFTLNAVGNVTGLTERISATATASRAFTYDGLDRLTGNKNGATTIEGFTYDATGNRMSKTAGAATAYSYATTSHKLMAVGSTARSYDAAGNTTVIGTNNKGSSFSYDNYGRMRDFTKDRKLTASYRYNGKGERVLKTHRLTSSLSRQFVYDEAGHLLGEYTTAGARVKEYVWLDNTLVAVLGEFTGKKYRLVESDHLGTPRAVIHPDTNVIEWRWDLNQSAFGEHVANQNPDGDSATFDLPLRFPGQYHDAESGKQYNYFRDYDPSTARYLQSDPIGLRGGPSTFAYVRSSPLNLVDPLGLVDVNLLPTNYAGYQYAQNYNPSDVCTITGHGNPVKMIDAAGNPLTPHDVGDLVRQHCPNKRRVRLISCNTGLPGHNGSTSFGEKLLNDLGAGYSVAAPDNFTWWLPNGPEIAGTKENETWATYAPGDSMTYDPSQPGSWNNFSSPPP